MKNEIITYLENNNLLSTIQQGFRKERSCLSNLLAHYDWLLKELARGGNVDIVYLDFAKAFVKVDHGIFLHKLKSLGITARIGVWLHNFLTSRTQIVAIDGYKSEKSPIISGVSQVSVLGPRLFLALMRETLPVARPAPISPPLLMTQPSATASTVRQTYNTYKPTCKKSSTGHIMSIN